MAGRSKKPQDNFEKMKREMTVKKQKSEKQQNLRISQDDTEDNDLSNGSNTDNSAMQQNVYINAAIQNIDKGKNVSKEQKKKEKGIQLEFQQDTKIVKIDESNIKLVIFRIDEEEYALRLSSVKEIIRVPTLTQLPNTPQYIIGMCSLRGELLPVIDSRILFGLPIQEFSETSRVVVTEINGQKVGLVSDKVSEVISINGAIINEPPANIKGTDEGAISGILILNNGKRMVMILDSEKIIKLGEFSQRDKHQSTFSNDLTSSEKQEHKEDQIVVFNIGAEEYGININYVSEIIKMPDIIKVPNSSSYIEGMFSIKKQLLAVINLGKLLGVNCHLTDEYNRIIIINNGKFAYGVIVDKVSHIIGVKKELFIESNQMGYCSSSDNLKGVYNLNNGSRLIMILEPDKLISFEDTMIITGSSQIKQMNGNLFNIEDADNKLEHIVIFKLGKEEYAIEINNVHEINRINEITHFPGAPFFIIGMVDLRGEIIPILNLRRLFGFQDLDMDNNTKIIVVELEKKKIGILIDSVSDILLIPMNYFEAATEVLDENSTNNYIDKIAKLNNGKRLVMILNLSALLSFM